MDDHDVNRAGDVAIIGDGVAALITFAVLRHEGVPDAAITVYGDGSHPLANLSRYTCAIQQETMRSESNGHLAAVDFPGLALIEAIQNRSPWPLLSSLFDRYTPPLALLRSQADTLTEKTGYGGRRVNARVAAITRTDGMFAIHHAQAGRLGMAQHVILALGHAGPAWPTPIYAWCDHPAVSHAYEKRGEFVADEQVVVVGAGMAAAHVWSAALTAGARVLALHRHPLRRQRLAAPRSAFNTANIEAYQQLTAPERLDYLRRTGRGTFPWRTAWERQRWWARRHGRFVSRIGEVAAIQEQAISVSHPERQLVLRLADNTLVRADKLVCATGFQTDPCSHTVIRQLVEQYAIRLCGEHLHVANDFTLIPASQPNSLCTVVGALSRWALPVADTFAGIKYVARRIAPILRRSCDSAVLSASSWPVN